MKASYLSFAICAATLLGSGAAFASSPSGSAGYVGGEGAQDSHISQRVAAKIDREVELNHERGNIAPPVHVRTDDGVVTLSGNVWTHRAEDYVLQAAESTSGVAAVRNHLNVPH